MKNILPWGIMTEQAFLGAFASGEPSKITFKMHEYLVAKLDGGWLVSYGDGYPICICQTPEEAMEKITALIEACEKADSLMEKAAKAAGMGMAEQIAALERVTFMIKHEGDKWNVYDSTGKQKLGSHDTEADAKKQLAAIETAKAKKKSEMSEKGEQERFAASLVERDFEVLSAGTWNKRTFTCEDLAKIAANTMARLSYLKPVLKIGHDDEQALAKSAGLPAMGWMKDIRLVEDKLVATFAGIPEGLDKLLGKAWKRVSCELLFGWRDPETGKPLTVMSAVALLGEELPAVTNLADIAALYGEEWTAAQDRFAALVGGFPYAGSTLELMGERVQFTYPKEDVVEPKIEPKPETVSKEAFAASLESIKALEARLAESAARETERVKLSAEERIEAALTAATTEARIIPAQREALKKALCAAAGEHVRVAMAAKPGEKTETLLDLMLAEVKARPAMKGLYREFGISTEEPVGETLSEDQALKMAQEIEEKEKVSFAQAYAKVRSQHTVKKVTQEISESGNG